VLEDLKVAAVFLTRLRIPLAGTVTLKALADSVYTFPLVGALVGAAGGLVYAFAAGLGLPSGPAAALALAAMVAATGALHEDGLADTADALGAAGDRERALEVMRDSRIGSYGAAALALALLLRWTALAGFGDALAVLGAAVAAAAFSRALMPAVMFYQPSARARGLAAGAGRPQPERVYAGLGIGALLALLSLPMDAALRALAGTALVGAALAVWLGRRFGGCTGDTLGAVQQVAEIVFLHAALSAR